MPAGLKYRNDLTAEQVRAALTYCPETGLFRREVRKKTRVVGSRADTGHILIWVAGRLYKAHRLAWLMITGEWPKGEIDHRNRCPSDNRWVNLREATRGENTSNRSSFPRKYDLPRGVTLTNGRYRAQIKINGRNFDLGYFDTAKAAHAAYLAKALPIRGEFIPEEAKLHV